MGEADLRAEVARLGAAMRALKRENESLKRDAELARLRNENALLRRQDGKGVTLKVSQKGAVSLYGIQRFPVTLYRRQWERVLAAAEDIRSFIIQNAAVLSETKRGDHAS
jgi:hypothetical protein